MRQFRVLVALLAFAMYPVVVKAKEGQCIQYIAGPEVARPGPILSMISVKEGFPLASVSVLDFKLEAAKIASLKITLSAGTQDGPVTTIVLKDIRSGGNSTKVDAAIQDAAGVQVPFPSDGSADVPLTGLFTPAEPLAGLTKGGSTLAGKGGSQGTWLLRVVDLQNASRPINLQGWTLVLCPSSDRDTAEVAASSGPADTNSSTTNSTATVPSMNSNVTTSNLPLIAELKVTNLTSTFPEITLPSTTTGVNTSTNSTTARIEQLLNELNSFNTLGDNNIRTRLGFNGTQRLAEMSTRINQLLGPYNNTTAVKVLNGALNSTKEAVSAASTSFDNSRAATSAALNSTRKAASDTIESRLKIQAAAGPADGSNGSLLANSNAMLKQFVASLNSINPIGNQTVSNMLGADGKKLLEQASVRINKILGSYNGTRVTGAVDKAQNTAKSAVTGAQDTIKTAINRAQESAKTAVTGAKQTVNNVLPKITAAGAP